MGQYILKHETFRQIQDKFNKQYPYLKIELLHNTQLQGKPPYLELRSGHTDQYQSDLHGRMSIDGERTVAEVERDFWIKFGLAAKIFRKSGNSWIATSLTDDWTLNRQNEEGRIISQQFPWQNRLNEQRPEAE